MTRNSMTALTRILKSKIVAIIRGSHPEDVPRIVETLHGGGIDLIEITMNSPQALELIRKLNIIWGDKLLIGAGTILDAGDARKAIEAGARFILSPATDEWTIRMTRQNNAVSIPGAFTPTEILQAYSMGGDIIKVFPARLGPDYIRDILAPLPHIPLMPTGGVNLENIREFKKAGAIA
ncbi:MAG TPA: bifunctional 4-hydroxy-2-oxoglutarate aldolase/2-dehydro-3-deoxy-phosphogluconate aldolase, partial [Puia sp.]|nr:bifunctional 4-hydroxy-2-oxoglutarate aldolase/2-dehydro-3-deoxy-phosphogluconate aldolase [Puia sp.]